MNSLEQLCAERKVSYEQVLAVIDLYNSDEPEDTILSQIYTYPENVRKLVSTLIFPC